MAVSDKMKELGRNPGQYYQEILTKLKFDGHDDIGDPDYAD